MSTSHNHTDQERDICFSEETLGKYYQKRGREWMLWARKMPNTVIQEHLSFGKASWCSGSAAFRIVLMLRAGIRHPPVHCKD